MKHTVCRTIYTIYKTIVYVSQLKANYENTLNNTNNHSTKKNITN